MPGLILASVPVNSEAGSYLTFWFPVALFSIVAAILWLLYSRPHRRIPPRRAPGASQAAVPAPVTPAAPGTGGAGNVSGTTASSEAPPAGAAATDETAGPDTTKGPDKNTEASE